LIERFRYLQLSLVFILAYVGVKMLLSHVHPIPNHVSLFVIAAALAVGVIASWALTARQDGGAPAAEATPVERFSIGTMKQVRRFTILIAGGALIVVGAVLLVLPGPSTLVIAMGLVGAHGRKTL
jgi:tellurite resistance protein TerC